MGINFEVKTLKTKEIVFHRPRLPKKSLPLCFPTLNEQIVPEFLVSIFLPHYPTYQSPDLPM